jgi:prepilin-type N-terminal cleavage/methylation domain-containing protein
MNGDDVVGLDIGERSVAAVQLRSRPKGRWEVRNAGVLELAQGATDQDVAHALQTLWRQTKQQKEISMQLQPSKRGYPIEGMQETAEDNKQQKDMLIKMKSRKSGFTLVELMIVAVIVAVLAAVAIPLMSANKQRAIMTEAEAGLGAMRSSMRTLYAETGSYNTNRNGVVISGADAACSCTNIPGVNTNDFTGRWFDYNGFELLSANLTPNTYTLQAKGSLSTAPNAADVNGLIVTLDQNGTFVRTGY